VRKLDYVIAVRDSFSTETDKPISGKRSVQPFGRRRPGYRVQCFENGNGRARVGPGRVFVIYNSIRHIYIYTHEYKHLTGAQVRPFPFLFNVVASRGV